MSKKLSMDDALIQKLKEILEANLSNENFGVSELATEAGISRSQLHRRLKDSIGKSSSQFIREYREKLSFKQPLHPLKKHFQKN